jgi:dephospho-CoA kinase
MIAIGLTGGIGSGKSTVARLFAGHGVRVVDADAIAHEVMTPDTPVFDAVVERFGRAIVAPDGTIDRQALAAVVFADDAARGELEAIVHPTVSAFISAELDRARAENQDVLVDIPLLVETDARGRYGFDLVVVVDAPEPVVLDRLMRERAMDEDAARARMAAQSDRAVRLAAADVIIDNSGTLDELADMVENVWQWIVRFGPGSGPLDLTLGRPPR